MFVQTGSDWVTQSHGDGSADRHRRCSAVAAPTTSDRTTAQMPGVQQNERAHRAGATRAGTRAVSYSLRPLPDPAQGSGNRGVPPSVSLESCIGRRGLGLSLNRG